MRGVFEFVCVCMRVWMCVRVCNVLCGPSGLFSTVPVST